MKEIALTQGKFALVDDADYEWLNQWKWYCSIDNYAVREMPKGSGKRGTIRMHREIMNTPIGMETDHIDRNRLNNQRSNLRICTTSQNQSNVSKNSANTSGYKGVHRDRIYWRAQLKINNVYVLRENFPTAEAAARAYDRAAREHFGEFANTNFKD